MRTDPFSAPSSPLVKELLLPNGAYITNVYDGNGRLTGTALQNSGGTNIDAEGYVYNQGNQRTQQVFTAGNFMNYTYDGIGQLQTALGKEPGGVTNRLHEQFGYTYDAAGNLKNQTNNALVRTLFANSLNELYLINHGGTLTVDGTTTSPATNVTVNTSNAVLYVDNTFASANQSFVSGTNFYSAIARDSYGRMDSNTVQTFYPSHENLDYDLNGNLMSENGTGGRNFAYDDENQLIAVWVTNSWMSQFTYDGKMRRRIRKEYTWDAGTSGWQLTNEVHYVYDGNVVIQERDANNLPQVTYTRGSGGGLLARTANPLTLNPPVSAFATAFYHADGNGNITALIYTNQTIAAKYEYDPYGNVLNQIGPLANANLYRFSSQEYHAPSGLIIYLRRFYDPNLQRWINRDPIEERGGFNLYRFVENNPVNRIDPLGLLGEFIGGAGSFGGGGAGGSWDPTPDSPPSASDSPPSAPPNIPVGSSSGAPAYAAAAGAGTGVAGPYLWSAGLNGGNQSVFWSGYQYGARDMAECLGGTTLEQTPIGGALDFLSNTVGVPGLGPILDAASATFAGNATAATAVILAPGATWTTIELPILLENGIPILFIIP